MRADDLTALSGWRTVDVSELETLRGQQCDATLNMPALGELVRCVRQKGHDGHHWADLVNRR